jgi:hypothetical protein
MSNTIRRFIARFRLPGPTVVWDPAAGHWRAERSMHRPYGFQHGRRNPPQAT